MSTEPLYETTTGQPFISRLPLGPRWGELASGDEMSRDEFHRIYEESPEDFKAELIEGVVYVASPLRMEHGRPHGYVIAVLAAYEGKTPGVQFSDNTTLLLGKRSEPQPDAFLRIRPEFGGQTKSSRGYVEGCPELVVEIANSSRAIDLHKKKDMYARNDAREYLVGCVEDQRFRLFDLVKDDELQPDASGVFRSREFPGLWIDGPAIIREDYDSIMQTLEAGLATPEHAAFVVQLANQKASSVE